MTETLSAQQRIITISNIKGLHARAAAKFVKVVNAHEASVKVVRTNATQSLFEQECEFQVADGSSVLGILTLGAEKGAEICISAEGADAEKVLAELCDLIDRKFDEE